MAPAVILNVLIISIPFQPSSPMVPVHHGIPKAGTRVGQRDDLFDCDSLWHAHACLLLHPHLQLEDDQGHGILHVHLLFHLCCRFTGL